jgi:hypothetical protein
MLEIVLETPFWLAGFHALGGIYRLFDLAAGPEKTRQACGHSKVVQVGGLVEQLVG